MYKKKRIPITIWMGGNSCKGCAGEKEHVKCSNLVKEFGNCVTTDKRGHTRFYIYVEKKNV